MPDIWTTKSNMTCHTFEYQNQTWRARNSNNRIKHGVLDIRTKKSNMTCRIFQQQNQTYCARHSNNKIKHGVSDIRTTKSNMACQKLKDQNQIWRARHSNKFTLSMKGNQISWTMIDQLKEQTKKDLPTAK